ncbi:MAG: hypothetical protein A2Y23_11920 [Clostridiales bacterium GWB2_37_7]|nr:MAG: hypothetical protein A2Y23_11920 [Clostridiales bacterium GWB2_37_7]
MTDTQIKRSGCLTAFIIVLIVLYVFSALGSFLAGPMISAFMPEYSTNTLYIIFNGILAVLNIVFLVGVWRYKKWGFFGFVAVSILYIIFSIIFTGSVLLPLISGPIFPLILYFLIKPVWNHMK